MTELPLYLAGLAALLTARYLYSLAGAPQLRWLLAPVAWLAQHFGKIPFLWDLQLGYISHPYRFILAPSCSGFQFMLIAAATLYFTFLHRMETKKEKLGWTLSSLMTAYLFTIFVNSLRVILSVYVPLLLEGTDIFRTWLTKDRFHTATGVLVYFPALLLLYQMARAYLDAHQPKHGPAICFTGSVRRYIPPVFWYLFFVLGLPFLHQACQTHDSAFWSYALLVVSLCLVVLLLLGAILWAQRCYLPPPSFNDTARRPLTDTEATPTGQQEI